MSIVVVGSVFFDTIETPQGRAERVLGGAATHFSIASSFFAPVRVVATVGDDFPDEEFDAHRRQKVDLGGVERRPGRTGSWSGRYHDNMNVRDTLALDLGVFADFRPRLPDDYRRAEHLFLGNIDPTLQENVLEQLEHPAVVACDTMDHWIHNARPALEKLLRRVRILLINDEEARLLSGEYNLVRAARRILGMGPESLLIKRGEYGVIHFSGDSVFAVPAFPLEEVFDPTGAGDAFAGGFVGSLARSGSLAEREVRRAVVYGSVMGSFIVEDFGFRRLARLTSEEIEQRYRQFVALTNTGD